MDTMSLTSKIYPNVTIGEGTIIEDGCMIGIPKKGNKPGELETTIGRNCVIRSGTYIYAGNKIGDNFQTGNKANIREQNIIGNNVSVGTLSVVEHDVIIEDNVRVHTQVFIPEFTILKKGCWIGPNVVFTNAFHPLCPDAQNCLKGATVEEGAKIGANSTIMPAVIIGKNALIGAGSLVTKDVTANKVAAGHPAKEIKDATDITCKYGRREKPYEDTLS